MTYHELAPLTPEEVTYCASRPILNGYAPHAERLHISQTSWDYMTQQDDFYIPDEGPWHIDAHSNRLQAPGHLAHLVWPIVSEETPIDPAITQVWKNDGLHVDQLGRALNPFAGQLLTHEMGMVSGPGFYWKYGPNATTNLIMKRERAGQPAEYATVRKAGVQGWFLPGGFVDLGETTINASLREGGEETGLAPDQFDGTAVQTSFKVGMSNRDTLHAWMEDSAVTIVQPNMEYLFDVPLAPSDPEIEEAAWKTLATIRAEEAQDIFRKGHLHFILESEERVAQYTAQH